MLLDLGLVFPLLLGILELAEIHDLADRWIRGWRNLDEIEVLLPGQRSCLIGSEDAELFTGIVDDTDSGYLDLIVDPKGLLSLSRKKSP